MANRIDIRILLASLAITLAAFAFIAATQTPGQVACTMEAKICPDGSYVGRTGPNCEFAPCPASACQADADCVPEQCCHPTSCTSAGNAPDCSAVSCTASCEGPLDCNAGHCGCISGTCAVVPS